MRRLLLDSNKELWNPNTERYELEDVSKPMIFHKWIVTPPPFKDPSDRPNLWAIVEDPEDGSVYVVNHTRIKFLSDQDGAKGDDNGIVLYPECFEHPKDL
jgi:hypothetical protein